MSSKKVTDLEFKEILEGIYNMACDFGQEDTPKKFMRTLRANPTDKYRRLISGKLTPAQQTLIFYYATRNPVIKHEPELRYGHMTGAHNHELADALNDDFYLKNYNFAKLLHFLEFKCIESVAEFYINLWNCKGSWSALIELINTYNLKWIKNNYLYKKNKTYNIGTIDSLESGTLVKLFSRYSEYSKSKEGFTQVVNDFVSITNETVSAAETSLVMLLDNNHNKDINAFSAKKLLYKEQYAYIDVPARFYHSIADTDNNVIDLATPENFIPYNMLSVVTMLINLDKSQKESK